MSYLGVTVIYGRFFDDDKEFIKMMKTHTNKQVKDHFDISQHQLDGRIGRISDHAGTYRLTKNDFKYNQEAILHNYDLTKESVMKVMEQVTIIRNEHEAKAMKLILENE